MNKELKELQIAIGSRIKYYRTKQKLTQVELATKAKLPSASRVSEYERGSYSIGFETLLKLSQALEVEIADLIDDRHFTSFENEIYEICNKMDQLIKEVVCIQNHLWNIKKSLK